MKASDKFRDNTQLSSYKDCPRKWFLRHYLHWRSEGTSLPLCFGLSWHDAMDVVWQHARRIPRADLPDLAYARWCESWEEQGLPVEMDLGEIERYSPRTPAIAREMLHAYIDERWTFLQGIELIAVEQPFAVPMPGLDNTWYCGKLDKVFKHQSDPYIGEHKSTTEYKKDGGFKTSYLEGWFSDSQVKGYEFGGSLFYPGLSNVWVDAALVHKTVRAFRFIPVAHQFPLIQEWVRDTSEWIRRLELETLEFERIGELPGGLFPKNENSCMGKYGPCTFLDICRTTPDPTKLTEPPAGYIVEKWEPFDILGLSKLLEGGTNG